MGADSCLHEIFPENSDFSKGVGVVLKSRICEKIFPDFFYYLYKTKDKEKIIEFYKNNVMIKISESKLKSIIKESVESVLSDYRHSYDKNVINILYKTLEELQPYCQSSEIGELCDTIQDFIDRNSYSRD